MAEKGTESGQDQHVTAPEPPKLLPEVLHGGSSPAQLVLSSSKEAKRDGTEVPSELPLSIIGHQHQHVHK